MTELWHLGATEIAARVRSRELSAVDVARSHLDRVEKINPAINAIVDSNPTETLAEAAALDDRLARGKDVGCLAGVPVTIKINTDQKGFATTGGLSILKDNIAGSDGSVVTSFRKAGAVILGRSNMPAFGMRWFTSNQLHGSTTNPVNRTLTPGGSSGGASAAIAAGLGCVAQASDIAGSIRYPAYACGVHGLRPSLGRVAVFNPSSGDRGIGPQLMAVSGPIARRIADLRLALRAMSERDTRDPQWVPAPLDGPVRSRRVAMTRNPDGLETCREVDTALGDAAARLAEAGWDVVEVECPPLRELAQHQAQLWLSEYARKGTANFEREKDMEALEVLHAMQSFAPEPGFEKLYDALLRRAYWIRVWEAFLESFSALLLPVCGELPFKDREDVESRDRFAEMMNTQLTQIALPALGVPALTVTVGRVGSTPVGVQVVASRFREDLCLEVGEDIERGASVDRLFPLASSA